MVAPILFAGDGSEARALGRTLAASFEVDVVGNIEAAWARLSTSAPKMAILEVSSERQALCDLLRRIRADPVLDAVYVVLLAGSEQASADLAQALDCGVNGYISWPSTGDELVAQVRMHLRNAELADALRASEARYRDLMMYQADAVLVVDDDGHIRYANPAAATLFGRDHLALLGERFGFPVSGDGTEEINVRRPDNRHLVVEMRARATVWGRGSARIATFHDVTVQREQQRLLLASELNLARAQHIAGIGSYAFDPAAMRFVGSAELYRLLGLPGSPEPRPYSVLLDACIAADRVEVDRARRGALRGESLDIRYQVARADGTVRWIREQGEISDESGRPQLIGTLLDITDRHVVESRLARVTRMYRTLSEINEAILRSHTRDAVYDAACRIAVTSGGFVLAAVFTALSSGRVRLLHSYGDIDGHFARIEFDLDDPIMNQGTVGRALSSGTYDVCNDVAGDERMAPWRNMMQLRGFAASAAFPFCQGNHVEGALVVYAPEAGYFEQDIITLLVAVADDITHALESLARENHRRNAEIALAAAQRHLQLVLASVGDGIFVVDDGGVVLMQNRSASMMTGWSDRIAEGKLLQDYLQQPSDEHGRPPEMHTVQRTLQDGISRKVDNETFARDTGERIPVEYLCAPIRDEAGWISGAVVSLRDIAERRWNERLQSWEVEILRTISAAEPLSSVLTKVILEVEELIPGARGSVSMVAADDGVPSVLRHVAAPHLPAELVEKIQVLPIGPMAGACGASAFRGEPVFVSDVATDPLCADYREIAIRSGVRACWSMPALDSDGKAVAVFAIYHRDVRAPDRRESQLGERAAYIIGIAIHREASERALRSSEERFRLTFAHAATGLAITAPDGRYVQANAAFCRMLGYSEAELRATTALEITHPDDRERSAALTREIFFGARESILVERRYLGKDGRLVWMRLSIAPLRDSNGAVVSLIGVGRDITDERHAQENAQRSQALLRIASQISRLGAWVVDVRSGLVTWSEELRAILEVSADFEPEARALLAFCANEQRDKLRDIEESCLREGAPFDIELPFVTAQGRSIWARVIGEALRDASDSPVRVHGAFQDVTAQRAAEQAVIESEERFRVLSKATDDAIWDLDLVSNTIWWNETFARLTAMPALHHTAGETRTSRIHPEDFERVSLRLAEAVASGRESWSDAYRFRRADNTYIFVEERGYVIRDGAGRAIRMIGGMTDVTARRDLEEQLRQSQRLDSVGQLTGGVAHDFNNLLTVIMGNAEVLVEALSGDEKRRELAAMILGVSQRGAELTQRLLAFARKQMLDPKAVDANRLVAGMEGLLRRTLGAQLEMEYVRGVGLWATLVDPGQLENALLNLCLNARDAMPDGGRLTIETANVRLDEEYCARQVDLRPGQYVMVTVSDTGVGIASENLGRVFDQFCTTKEKGGGTGLGLAMVYGFIKQSGGHINIYSEVGQGTAVKMYLPRLVGGHETLEAVAERVPEKGGRETILLVEDDAQVRQYAREQLLRLGYEVVEAANGAQALARLREREDIALLFTDVVMPGGISGQVLAQQALRERPGLKVLYTSGYTENAIVHQGRLDPGVRLLQKPYRRSDLASKVRQALQ